MGLSPSKQNAEGLDEKAIVKEVNSLGPGTVMSHGGRDDVVSEKEDTSVEKMEIGEPSSASESMSTKPQSHSELSEDMFIDLDSNLAMYTDIKMRRRQPTKSFAKIQRRSPRALSPLSSSTCTFSSSRSNSYKSSSQSDYRKRIEKRSRKGTRESRRKPALGELGYTFTKYFDGHGWFTGRVVKIRYKAGRCRMKISYVDHSFLSGAWNIFLENLKVSFTKQMVFFINVSLHKLLTRVVEWRTKMEM